MKQFAKTIKENKSEAILLAVQVADQDDQIIEALTEAEDENEEIDQILENRVA